MMSQVYAGSLFVNRCSWLSLKAELKQGLRAHASRPSRLLSQRNCYLFRSMNRSTHPAQPLRRQMLPHPPRENLLGL